MSRDYNAIRVYQIRSQVRHIFARLSYNPNHWIYNDDDAPERLHIFPCVEARKTEGSYYESIDEYVGKLDKYRHESDLYEFCHDPLDPLHNTDFRAARVTIEARTVWRRLYGIPMLNTEKSVIVVYDWTFDDNWTPRGSTKSIILHPCIHVQNRDKTAIEYSYSVEEVDDAVLAVSLIFKPFPPLPGMLGCGMDTFTRERASDIGDGHWDQFQCHTALFHMEWRQDMYRREVLNAAGMPTLYPRLAAAYPKYFGFWLSDVAFRTDDVPEPRFSDVNRLRMSDAIIAWDLPIDNFNLSARLTKEALLVCNKEYLRFLEIEKEGWTLAGGHPFEIILRRNNSDRIHTISWWPRAGD